MPKNAILFANLFNLIWRYIIVFLLILVDRIYAICLMLWCIKYKEKTCLSRCFQIHEMTDLCEAVSMSTWFRYDYLPYPAQRLTLWAAGWVKSNRSEATTLWCKTATLPATPPRFERARARTFAAAKVRSPSVCPKGKHPSSRRSESQSSIRIRPL